MNTVFWGKSGWLFLHTLTFIYPEAPLFNTKVKMREFMTCLQYILPCKYCRSSLTKYMKSLPIDNYLDTRLKLIEWLYKIHNKINKKLRIQGFCSHSNPNLDTIINRYTNNKDSILKDILLIINNESHSKIARMQIATNYICNLGTDFLGSIVFNYQGYYTNCHTNDEQNRIESIYNTFFNAIQPLIYSLIDNSLLENSKGSNIVYKTFKIRNILQHNQAYSKLIEWFYKCNDLCTMEKQFPDIENYTKHFNKHIVMSCNNPIVLKKTKSCRAGFKKSGFKKTRTQSRI